MHSNSCANTCATQGGLMERQRGLDLIFTFMAIVLCTASALAQTPIPLRVALGDVEVSKLPFVIAAEQGIYQKNGLNVTVFTTSSAAEFARRSGINVPAAHVSDGAPIT